ncbi:MAG: hypothetical protein BWY17_00848 [Deltaproteobacteria bacterium ADurb.Bin207]|jgi:hypothetical protein|nr:MAG: hypothetical protein BWY17_00848 [Deltaproteobacteria bacterium ADurb.Bin207]
MHLEGDNEWAVEIVSNTSKTESFTFDVFGDGRVTLGDDDGDQTAIVPAGIDASALNMLPIQLSVDGQSGRVSTIYVDEEHATAHVPVCCLSKGSEATLSIDRVVKEQRWKGEVTWVVDGSVDPIVTQLRWVEASLEDMGMLEVEVFSDRWEADHLVTSPYSDVGVYLGDWPAGNLLGHTGNTGEALFYLAPVTVVLRSPYDTGMGRALYLTGASSYLGDWQTATRMVWADGQRKWQRSLLLGLPFKIMLADWSQGEHISTSEGQWEQGPNRVEEPPQGTSWSEMTVYPIF